MASVLYYYDKVTNQKKELGEIQSNVNMSFVLDGTKDSCKVQVLSFTKKTLDPYTICYLEELDSWWIVANDKTERHANESGFFYVHNLQLMGANELLNARDLTDCGFYQNKYTIDQFVKRLFALSNFEYNISINYQNNIDSNKVVDYIKTYENYTLLSALRDFFGGYNCDVKLKFGFSGVLANAYLYIHSKTGNVNGTILDIDDFKDVRETRTINKNSYGSTVVSNVDNATASKMQVYPVVGGVVLNSNSNTLDENSAFIRLPSNLNDIEWVKMYLQCIILVKESSDDDVILSKSFYSFDTTYVEGIITSLNSIISSSYPYLETEWEQQREDLKTYLNEMGVCTFKKGISINAYNGNYENPNNLVIPEIHNNTTQQNLILVEDEVKSALVKPTDGIGYSKGSNKINIDFLGRTNNGWFTTASKSCDCGYFTKSFTLGSGDGMLSFSLGCGTGSTYLINAKNLLFAVKYEPMGDLKVKIDNDLEGNDIQVYNQNGKLTDGVAFSKLLNSYSKEITSDNLTRYMCYYKPSDIPKVGQLVNNNGDIYVISNISLSFYQCEQNGTFPYFVDAEITMSKQVAVKSLMVNPNSNIRDYGIPQKHTVKRKQLYRDYCEFIFENDLEDNDFYMPVLNVFSPLDLEMSKCGIKVSFADENSYYYQLDTTRYVFKKMLITMLDFQDNNIIGYDFQNRFSGFDISRVLSPSGFNNLTSVPIQYTDNNGCIEKVEICWLTSYAYNIAIDYYVESQSGEEYKYVLTSRVFINADIYNIFDVSYTFKTNETSYKKDPLEIPVFEHTFQIGDTPEVQVGEDIFVLHKEGLFNVFAWEYVNKNLLNENNALAYSTHNINQQTSGIVPTGFDYEHSAKLDFQTVNGNSKQYSLKISLYNNFDSSSSPQYTNPLSNIDITKDLAIYRYEYNLITNTTIKTLMFIIRLNENTDVISNVITLYAKQYKLLK